LNGDQFTTILSPKELSTEIRFAFFLKSLWRAGRRHQYEDGPVFHHKCLERVFGTADIFDKRGNPLTPPQRAPALRRPFLSLSPGIGKPGCIDVAIKRWRSALRSV